MWRFINPNYNIIQLKYNPNYGGLKKKQRDITHTYSLQCIYIYIHMHTMINARQSH